LSSLENSPSTRAPAICVVGAALIDLVSYVPRLPMRGETLHGTDFQMGFGGKGANQAVMAAKLGAIVSIVTRVGRDFFGDGMLGNFQSAGIDTTHLTLDESAPSGVAPIAVDPQGNNAIIIVTGANARMTVGDVEAARAAIADAEVLICQLEVPIEVTLAALRVAHEESTLAILNPAPAAPGLACEAYEWPDVFCPNESEAELLLGRPVEVGGELEAARELRSRGAHAVILTLAERGCVVASAEEELLIPAERVEAVDTTGAGDAFVGTLAYFLAVGKPPAEAAARANRVAAVSVQRRGTQTSFPSAGELPRDVLA
jgi:ribokinase